MGGQGSRLACKPTKGGLGFADLLGCEAGHDGLQARCRMLRLDLKGGLFGGRFLARLEIPADANSEEESRHPPGNGAGRILEPAYGERYFVAHAKVATSTGNFASSKTNSLNISE